MNRIIIEVFGGIVSTVYASNPNVTISVLDIDNMEQCDPTVDWQAEELARYKALEEEVKTLDVVY